MFRKLLLAYLVLCAGLIGFSLYTGHRATKRTGEPHYLFTSTHVLVRAHIEPEDEGEAELDAAFAEAGEDTRVTALEPMFVLGLIDATGPIICLGALMLAMAAIVRRRRHPPVASGNGGGCEL